MRKVLAIMVSGLLLLSCGSEAPKARRAVMDYETGVERTAPDTAVQGKAKRTVGTGKAEKVKTTATEKHKPGNDDNMRGFDPASEDDLPDNGMNRYMENNDEEGWE